MVDFSSLFDVFHVYFHLFRRIFTFCTISCRFQIAKPHHLCYNMTYLSKNFPQGGVRMRRKMLLSYITILLAFCAVTFVFVLRTVYSMVQTNLIETSSQTMQRWS